MAIQKIPEYTEIKQRANDQRTPLADFEERELVTLSYEEQEGEYGPYVILNAVCTDTGDPVTVTTGAKAVVERVREHFTGAGDVPLHGVPIQRISKRGRQYWVLQDPVQP